MTTGKAIQEVDQLCSISVVPRQRISRVLKKIDRYWIGLNSTPDLSVNAFGVANTDVDRVGLDVFPLWLALNL